MVLRSLLGSVVALALAGAVRAAEPSRYLLEPDAVWTAGDAARSEPSSNAVKVSS